ncbi:MAG: DUF362 domain-containing protein [Candidatus Latescibacteria bacterium]|jgi:uncharacterized protein (DUF362 family)|nr:DUF362 domain-containing protein [Candidatus Latescibacterota bacterium]
MRKSVLFDNMPNRRMFLGALTGGIVGVSACARKRSTGIKAQSGAKPLPIPRNRKVIFRTGSDRRQVITNALIPLQSEVAKAISDKQVIVKVNCGLVDPQYVDCSTHADEIRAILDFLEPIYDRQILISEGTASKMSPIASAYENYGYLPLQKEYNNIKFIDANDQQTNRIFIRAAKQHPVAINVIAPYMDPNVYLISAARMKTHNCVVGTFSLKNVVMGSPQCRYWDKNSSDKSDKPKMHGGQGLPESGSGRDLSYNMFTLALAGVRPDLAVIDGVQSIEGNGPWNGDVVDHGVVVASTDFVAADRLCTELIGIDPFYMKYLEWCGNAGMGNWNMSKINVDGPNYKDYVIKYKLNKNVENQIAWIDRNFER